MTVTPFAHSNVIERHSFAGSYSHIFCRRQIRRLVSQFSIILPLKCLLHQRKFNERIEWISRHKEFNRFTQPLFPHSIYRVWLIRLNRKLSSSSSYVFPMNSLKWPFIHDSWIIIWLHMTESMLSKKKSKHELLISYLVKSDSFVVPSCWQKELPGKNGKKRQFLCTLTTVRLLVQSIL